MKPTATTAPDIEQRCANTIRMLAIDAVNKANSGHPGLPLGAADIVTVLWTRFLKHNPNDPTWPNRDRFILSAGHGSAMLYALLHLSGYPITLEALQNFRQWGSHTAGHPEYNPYLGIEITTGPLGQGISAAVGMALAERHLAARFNRPGHTLVEHYTYVLASDGDLMEGVSHEACALAGHLGLGKLIVFFDDNSISIDGSTSLSDSTDTLQRFAAYGWHTQQVDGHDMEAVAEAIRAAQAESERPSLIACHTHIGLGSPLQDTAKVHGSPLVGENYLATKEHYGWPKDKPFYVPPDVRAHFETVAQRGAQAQAEWEQALQAYRAAYPDLAAEWDDFVQGKLPAGWQDALPDFTSADPAATRATSGKVLEALVPAIPTLIGGSADLSGSNKTKVSASRVIQRGDYGGNYIHYGIREHGMGAVMNGLALHGLRPYGGTFLVFADYMRGAIRLAALMGLPVIYVFSHDSIGLGEDGPTHQPVEQLLSLRAMPNLVVLRPADGNETAQAWKVALERKNGPTALALTRQKVPQITPRYNQTARGAYILRDATGQSPQIVLLASGSEVHLALEAYQILTQEGVAARVVSMPSWELFDAQPEAYRQSVLLPQVPKVAVEAGVSLGWERYIGEGGAVLGVDRFGASAPYQRIYREFGLTA
ncbi:MAG: transketolase, partial [Anaerolineae bacterium]